MEDGVRLKITVKSEEAPGLVDALRKWRGQSVDEPCASCGGWFYSREGSPVCFGCLRGDDHQLGLVRMRLLRVLSRRPE